MNKVQNLVSSNQCNISCHARYLFSQVDDHDGVACDSSSRVRRGILDPLPVVNPVDLQRRCTYVWGLAFFSSCLVGNGPWVLGILLLHIRRSPTHPPQRFGFLAPETVHYLWCIAQQAVAPLSIIEGDLGKIWGGMDGQADGIRLCNPDSIWRLTRVVPFILIVHVLYHKCLSVIVIRGPTLW